MQKLVLAGIALFALAPVSSAETTSPWSVRLRATYVNPVDHSDAAGPIPVNGISVSDKLIPEFDIDYAITSRWSCELVLTVPQEHAVKVTRARSPARSSAISANCLQRFCSSIIPIAARNSGLTSEWA